MLKARSAAGGKARGRGGDDSGRVQQLLGACLARDVPLGETLLTCGALEAAAFIEARIGSGSSQQWRICRVLRLHRDGALIRHVKVFTT